MISIKNGFNFIFNKLFYNLIIILLLSISTILLFFNGVNYRVTNAIYKAADPLVGQGIVYLCDISKGLNDNIVKEDIEGCEYIYRVYDNNFSNNGELNKLLAYDNDIINFYEKYLISGRLPKINDNGPLEVLALKGTNELGDIITSKFKNYQIEMAVVGIVSPNIFLLKADTTGTSSLFLNDILQESLMIDQRYYIGLSQAALDSYPNFIKHINLYIKYPSDYYEINKEQILCSLNEMGYAYSIDDIYSFTRTVNKEELTYMTVILIVSVIASLLLMIINLVLLFNKNIMQLTVLYISGFSMKNIIQMLSLYIFLIVFFSSIISFLIIINLIPFMYPFGVYLSAWDYIKPLWMGLVMLIAAYVTLFINIRNSKLIENINKSI